MTQSQQKRNQSDGHPRQRPEMKGTSCSKPIKVKHFNGSIFMSLIEKALRNMNENGVITLEIEIISSAVLFNGRACHFVASTRKRQFDKNINDA